MKKKEKGFTLIELLAIIVILAIIAVITVPIILNIIENAKVGAAKNSAYGYKDAIDKYYVSQMSDNESFRLDGEYEISNGILKGQYLPTAGVNIPVSGTVPTSGTLQYENSKFKNGCLTMGDYAVTFNSDGTTKTEKGKCSGSNLVNVPYSFTRIVNGVAYASATDIKSNPIYYNPVTAEVCTQALYDANMEAAKGSVYPKTGCLKWYAYSKNSDGTVNMILAHNTTVRVEWIKDSIDYADGASVGISYTTDIPETWNDTNYSGPVTALKQLKADTSSWSIELLRSDTYSATIYAESYTYTINYETYKARLISAEEIAEITNQTSWTIGSDDDFYLDRNPWENAYEEGETSDYSWLYDYLHEGDVPNGSTVAADEINLVDIYCTSSPTYNTSERFWNVSRGASLSPYGFPSYGGGIRPVITIQASVISS